MGSPVEEKGEDQANFIYSERNRYGLVFFYFTHISILFILLGGIISSTLGIKGYMQVREGEKTDRFFEYTSNRPTALDFTLSCDKFDIEYYPESMNPKDYKSYLGVWDQGKEPHHLTNQII